ncbi:MAG: 2,3-bisphosphoglycerate-independent phosphoglycerate mutase [Patescibacteria group bacterium]
MAKRQLVLIVLDGWGIGRQDETNPIHIVKPESFRWLEENYPATSLQASGISVGLPWGEVGNSEVGHVTLGAGKILYQYYPKITMAIQEGDFYRNPALLFAVEHAKKNNSAVNLVGLLTKANVHASLEHLLALVKMAEENGVPEIKLHLFADGKDSAPKTIVEFLKEVPRAHLATIVGRYYAMDRGQNWRLTEAAYENMVGRGGFLTQDLDAMVNETLAKNATEEYLPALRLKEGGIIKSNEAIIFFNYREDSIRQLAEAFILKDFDKFPRAELKNMYIATMTHYEDKLGVPVAFQPDKAEVPLGQVLSEAGKTQLRVAETYKYAHVTFFFNAYREPPYKNEFRALIPSLQTTHPDENPELRASAVTDRVLESIQGRSFDFVLANYSNPDTIAHTANYEAGIQAVKIIDKEIGRLLKVALNEDTILVITSDHGNVEEMLDPMTALPESQHDPNPVPFYLVAPEFKGKKFLNWRNLSAETMGSLADVAPTILELMEIEKPKTMTGRSLLEGLI